MSFWILIMLFLWSAIGAEVGTIITPSVALIGALVGFVMGAVVECWIWRDV